MPEAHIEIARAKVNLTLHIGALRSDGYHDLESLVVFADFGDEVHFCPADMSSLTIEGADNLSTGADNLINRALAFCDSEPHQIHLKKLLPVSAGLGGGSANAAAIIRKFKSDKSDQDLAIELGADVPVCRYSKTSIMTGIGEGIEHLPDLGRLSAVLVNPGISVSTGEIFRSMDAKPRGRNMKLTSRTGDLLSRALSGGNDMQDFAIAQAPVISDVLRKLSGQNACQLARMSGSGATCFGIFRSDSQAQTAANNILKAHPDWWVKSCQLGDTT